MVSLQVKAAGGWSVTPGPSTRSDIRVAVGGDGGGDPLSLLATDTKRRKNILKEKKNPADFHSTNVYLKCLEMFIHNKHSTE